MGFRLRKNQSAGAGVRRVARELIDEAVERIDGKKGSSEENVHEVRKTLKKLRSVLRLVRDELGEDVYDRENNAARDLGRKLSAARDASVRVSALEKLREKSPEDFPERGVAPIVRRLVSRRRAAMRRARRSVLPAIGRELKDARRRVRTWALSKEGFDCLEPGLRRIYRQGKKGESVAYASSADDDFHEWRKRAKDLRYHVELLEPVWPEAMKDVAKTLHDLTDLLGDDHDLSDLRRVLTSSPRLTRGAGNVGRLVELIDRRRSRLQAEARPIGARIYGEKPRAFSARMGAYWEAWRS